MTERPSKMQGHLALGRYRIVKQLARGGMGVVYLARTEGAQGFTRPVIVKRILSDLAEDEAAARAFVREARILANLQHPGIVNVIDFNEEQGAYVMVLEYVHGYNLAQWHKYVVDTRGSMPVEYAIYIVTRVLDALQYAHTFVRADGTPMQIVHRDVSPGNILIDTQGHVKLLDFGIARADESDEYKTRDGMFKGKLSDSAPEVYDGITSPRSDVYSAGVVLYQLLSGENPFRGKDMAEIVRRVLSYKLPPIRDIRPDVSPELDAAVERAIVKNPQDRYPSAAAFADTLRSVRERREEDFATEFIDDVWNDFNGDMPAKLKLEPLQARDAAWRSSPNDVESQRATLSSLPPARDSKATIVERRLPPSEPSPETTATGPSRAAWLAALIAILAAGAAAYAFTAKKPETSSRFVVVERQSATEPAESSAASVPAPTPAVSAVAPVDSATPAPSASAPEAAASQAPRTKSTDVPPAGSKPDAAMLSRQVQKHRGAIESCFGQHV
ncbi:MAG TPA: serine/threonine-protein kinase, partial [Polyangiaceae bacterium]|nr:serine/threonine-protein kinase [Polyangiaceae bacterium]